MQQTSGVELFLFVRVTSRMPPLLPSARHPWTSATEEGSADVGVYEEVEQDHYGNDHTEDNIQGRGGGMRKFKCVPHQTDELNDHGQPESPALERPQPDGEDQGE